MKRYLRQYKFRNMLVITLTVIMSFLQISTNLINAFALDELIKLHMGNFLKWYVLFGIIWLIYLAIMRITDVQQQIVIQKMSTAIRHDISVNISHLSYLDFHKNPTNVYSSEYTNDLNMIEQAGFTNFFASIESISSVIFSIFALLTIHYSLIVTVIIMSMILLSVPSFFSGKLQEANIAVTKANGKFLGQVTDVLDGFNVLFSSGLNKLIVSKIEAQSHKLEEVKVDSIRKQTNIEVVITFFNVLAQFMIIVQTGILACLKLIPVGALGGTGGLAGAVFNGLGQLGNNIMQIKSVQPIFEKFHLNNYKAEVPTPIDGLHRGIKLTNITYSIGQHNVFKNLNVEFESGKKYALVGPSGSGKSTLLNIINSRIDSYDGEVTYDGINYNKLNADNIRDNMVYIDQNPYIFNETLRDNITLGLNYSDEDLQNAIASSSLQELVYSLPQGLDTILGKEGSNLSGGEKQRITLARGLITGKKIILMDESTSALDKDAALDIENTLVTHPKITLIMITHHLHESIASRLDNIIDITKINNID